VTRRVARRAWAVTCRAWAAIAHTWATPFVWAIVGLILACQGLPFAGGSFIGLGVVQGAMEHRRRRRHEAWARLGPDEKAALVTDFLDGLGRERRG
jgi:hypothetical protein